MIKRGPKRTWWSSERFADVFLDSILGSRRGAYEILRLAEVEEILRFLTIL